MNLLMKSHSIGTWGGIRVEIAYSLYLVAGIFALSGFRGSGWGIGVALLLPLCVLFHEMGHSYMAMYFRLRVRRIVLHGLGGVAELEGMMQSGPRAEIWIALAGPLASLLCATILGVLTYVWGGWDLVWSIPGLRDWIPAEGIGVFLVLLARMNLMLMVFNLLPIFPLDGGRIAAAFAVLVLGAQRGLRVMEPMAQVGAGIIIALGGMIVILGEPGGFVMIAVGFFILLTGRQELQARQYAVRYGAADPYEVAMLRQQEEAARAGEAWKSSLARDTQEGLQEGTLARWKREGAAKRAAAARAAEAERNREVDRILEKVNREGIASLTPKERAVLQSASESYRNR